MGRVLNFSNPPVLALHTGDWHADWQHYANDFNRCYRHLRIIVLLVGPNLGVDRYDAGRNRDLLL